MRRVALAVLLAACSQAGPEEQPDASDTFPSFPDARPLADGQPPIDAAPDAAPDAADPPPRYAADRESPLSPITPSVARNLQTISMRGDTLRDDVFAKVGDSMTVATQFLHCFAGDHVNLGGRTGLQDTIDRFKAGVAVSTNPFQRVSLAAKVGWSAGAAIAGSPTPLEQELSAILPRYAFVTFGSNDAAAGDAALFASFGPNLLDIVDRLTAQGVVPLMSTVPPNTQNATVGARIPRVNEIIRGIAQARQLPLVDYGREMRKLDGFGLGSDGLHPNSSPAGACVLDPSGLGYGYNLRNLLSIQSLARARGVVEGDGAPDPPASAPAVRGEGSYEVPFEINSFPWSDMRDTSRSPHMMISQYTGCNAQQDEGGPEYVYRLVLQQPTRIRAMVIDGAGVDIDVHLTKGLTGASCLARHDREIVRDLQPDTYYFILDTFVLASGMPQAGEYLFVVMEEPAE
jgi:hypothetical protein